MPCPHPVGRRVTSTVVSPYEESPLSAPSAWLTALDLSSGYPTDILPPLVVADLGLGLVMAPAMSLATSGAPARHPDAAPVVHM
ncbi:hypothetical protein [Streptomyces sp. ME19-01-6]|uniref:hypothetical protein n=1 Tax=Streptomyces sp. ME19-01-6 TaxID=3028686 RepID=UPI0029B81FC3|nr:hypothetical protein [Streptomyces sp. ME19-01-6]MDX3224928.1 hypothetical protein [Streptomyces sp. ME19-01-6]